MRIQSWAGLILSLGLIAGCGEDKTAIATAAATAEPAFQEMSWEELELPGQGLKEIMQKYQPQIDAIPEGGKGEAEVMEKMQAELDRRMTEAAKYKWWKIKIDRIINMKTGRCMVSSACFLKKGANECLPV